MLLDKALVSRNLDDRQSAELNDLDLSRSGGDKGNDGDHTRQQQKY